MTDEVVKFFKLFCGKPERLKWNLNLLPQQNCSLLPITQMSIPGSLVYSKDDKVYN